MAGETLFPVTWEKRGSFDKNGCALADRHYSRKTVGAPQFAPPGRKLILMTPDNRALWVSHWPYAELALDGLDAWRCSIFRNEGPLLSSNLIRLAMDATLVYWKTPPPDEWVTWINKDKVASRNPGFCFKKAGWWLDREWHHRHLIRLRANVAI